VIERVRPDYPEAARITPTNGRLEAWVWIDETGRVADTCTIHVWPEGKGFEEAGLAALERQRYEPAKRDGKAVPVISYLIYEWTVGPPR
jgi:hypothetical protein